MLERIVEFGPAHDGRPPDKGGREEWRTEGMKPYDGTGYTDYGVSGVDIRFVLKGPKGAVQFVVYTDWYPPHVQEEEGEIRRKIGGMRPMGADVGYHSPVPMYEDQPTRDSCPYLDGKPCYYDGSSLRADDWVRDILIKEGSNGVWKALEEEYDRRFENKEENDE